MNVPQTWVERVPAADINRRLDDWKRMRAAGWDVTVLLEATGGGVVVLACRHTVNDQAEAAA